MTELESLRAEVAALREEVRILRETASAPQVHHHYPPMLPVPAQKAPDWQQVIYPETVGRTTTIRPWQTVCAAADNGFGSVVVNSPYAQTWQYTACAAGAQSYWVTIPS